MSDMSDEVSASVRSNATQTQCSCKEDGPISPLPQHLLFGIQVPEGRFALSYDLCANDCISIIA